MKRAEWPWKPYAVFVQNGSGGWSPTWFDSFDEAGKWWLQQSYLSVSGAIIVEVKPLMLREAYFEREEVPKP